VTGPVPPYRTFDGAALLDKFGGDEAFVRGLFDVVQRTGRSWPADLRETSVRADLAGLAALAHKVKGTAGDLVATGLQARARDTELAARAGDPTAVGLGLALADEFETLLEEIRTAFTGAG
jgi:HPt (histidine-containing phosphotransfer) domain-containing protein